MKHTDMNTRRMHRQRLPIFLHLKFRFLYKYMSYGLFKKHFESKLLIWYFSGLEIQKNIGREWFDQIVRACYYENCVETALCPLLTFMACCHKIILAPLLPLSMHIGTIYTLNYKQTKILLFIHQTVTYITLYFK